MKKQEMVRIVKGYYDALEEGKILGRKCTCCDHIEFPPYLMCNECGCLDTEWIELNDMKGKVIQALPTMGAFGDPEFRQTHGDYWAIAIEVPHMHPFNSSLLHINPDMYDAFDKAIFEEDIYVHPILIQDVDTKIVVWELDKDSRFYMEPVITAKSAKKVEAETTVSVEATEEIDFSTDPIAMTVVECAAMAYDVDAATLTMATDIREDLANESMKMIVMISEIEEELGITIEIQEASNLNTLLDFVNTVKEKM